MTATLAKLICTECRHENEVERIYCHNCGARLDRSNLAPTKEPVKDTRDRVKKMFDPTRARIRALFFKTSKVLLGSCLVAAAIEIALPPDVPAPPKAPVLASQMRFDLEAMTSPRHQPPELQYTEEQVNEFLIYALKTKQTTLNKPLLDFKRASIAFNEGTCAVTAQRSFLGYSLYTSCTYAPTLKDGKLQTTVKSGRLGRLPIHPQVAEAMSILFSDIWSSLEPEIKMVRKLSSVEFHDKRVVLKAVQ